MKEKKYFQFNKYPLYNGTKLWIPDGYMRSITNKVYRRYPNPEKQYSECTIQNVRNVDLFKFEKWDKGFKSDTEGIVCDLISNNGSSTMPGIYITHKQIGTFVRNETKAMLADFDKTYTET